VLVWFRGRGDVAVVGAGFGVSSSDGLSLPRRSDRRARRRRTGPARVAATGRGQGWAHVVLDGKVFRTDRCAEATTSVKGKTVNSWYSGKHRGFGGNVQAITRPDDVPVWVSVLCPATFTT
jgi:hypothetical protein